MRKHRWATQRQGLQSNHKTLRPHVHGPAFLPHKQRRYQERCGPLSGTVWSDTPKTSTLDSTTTLSASSFDTRWDHGAFPLKHTANSKPATASFICCGLLNEGPVHLPRAGMVAEETTIPDLARQGPYGHWHEAVLDIAVRVVWAPSFLCVRALFIWLFSRHLSPWDSRFSTHVRHTDTSKGMRQCFVSESKRHKCDD